MSKNINNLFKIKSAIVKNYVNSLTLADQKSTDWHISRRKNIGGSEIYKLLRHTKSSLFELGKSKLNLDSTNWTIAPICWGNIFEPVITLYTEYIYKTTIYETGSIQGNNRCSNSPDGLGVINHEGIPKITLFEFKCPWSREIDAKKKIPKNYEYQMLHGMHVIPITEIAVYAEAVFRRCPLSQFKYKSKCECTTKEYPTLNELKDHLPDSIVNQTNCKCAHRHNDRYNDSGHNNDYFLHNEDVKACGLIFIYQTDEQFFHVDVLNEIDQENNYIDFGQYNNYYKLVQNYNYVSFEYSDICLNLDNLTQFKTEEIEKFKKYKQDNYYHFVGILPWKLFKYNSKYVHPNYEHTNSYQEKTKQFMEKIDHIRDNYPNEIHEEKLNEMIEEFTQK